MLTNDHQLNQHFSHTLRKVYKSCQDQSKHEKPDREKYLEQDDLRFLAASTDLKGDFDVTRFRHSIEQMLQLQCTRIVQVVGDCGTPFNTVMLDRARTIISSFVDDGTPANANTILEYGYTASKQDANWIINDLLASIPTLGKRTIGNVVHMSATAIEEWGCEATGLVSNFVLAYNNKETAFGSDTWLSDQVMDASCGDVLICLEGGPQAFSQAVDVCLNGVPVIVVTGSMTRTQPAPPRFSAACMLRIICDTWRATTTKLDMEILPGQAISLETTALDYLDNLQEMKNKDNRWKYEMIRASLKKLVNAPAMLNTIKVEDVDEIRNGP